MTDPAMDEKCVNMLRVLCVDAVQEANSGHPGAPMGLAPAAYVLYTKVMRHNPENPEWVDRDRFVLSGGHASALLYSILYLTGYDMSLEDIKNFRQWESKTPGHPEYGAAPGIETSTGPLGQGFANAVGMAMAERMLAARFNRDGHEIIDHYTYMTCGDGDLMEGVACEAASFAGHLGLEKLICVYDDNKITIEGETDITFTEDAAKRFEAYNWQVIRVSDGNDPEAIFKAVEDARAEKKKPSIIFLRTQIAHGSPNKQGTSSAHGSPLGEEEVRLTKKNLGCPEDECFCIPDDPLEVFRSCVDRGKQSEADWQEKFNAYRKAFPEMSEEFMRSVNSVLPKGWDANIPDFSDIETIATRAASGKVLNAIAETVPELVGGSADLAPSNNTIIAASHDFQKSSPDGRNIRFGVREHGMGGVLNGLALHRGLRPYGGTFLVFADYLRPSVRLAAMMKQPVIYVFTHDSVAVGEDGPTHQPVEHVAALRAIPDLTVIRPADATETAEAWKSALASDSGPTALILSRQKLPVLDRLKYPAASGLAKGAYVLLDSNGKPDVVLIASGSEVHLAIAALEKLAEKGISARVVSMPSWELFEKCDGDYRDSVIPRDVPVRIAVEAGISMGWERYTGDRGAVIGIDRFGASAPGGLVMEKFGFTVDNIVDRATELLT